MSNMQTFYTNLVQTSKQTGEACVVSYPSAATAVSPNLSLQQALFQLTQLTVPELIKEKNQIGWSGWWSPQ